MVLEGKLAGGHLGFSPEQLYDHRFSLESLLPDVLEVARQYGRFPVIVAGGLFSSDDIIYWHDRGAKGFKFGTRFAATEESGFSPDTKRMFLECSKKDIVVTHPTLEYDGVRLKSSPAGYPIRLLRTPILEPTAENPACIGCPIGPDGCMARKNPQGVICIGKGLKDAIDPNGNENHRVITIGANAWRLKEQGVVPAEKVVRELCGEV